MFPDNEDSLMYYGSTRNKPACILHNGNLIAIMFDYDILLDSLKKEISDILDVGKAFGFDVNLK